ncbi:MAG: hypothetical protein AB7V32_09600, partial [Candidatus Berkiella sp.]
DPEVLADAELLAYYQQQEIKVKQELTELQAQMSRLYVAELANPKHEMKSGVLQNQGRVLKELKNAQIGKKNGALFQNGKALNVNRVQKAVAKPQSQQLFGELKRQGLSDAQLADMGVAKLITKFEKSKAVANDAQIIFDNKSNQQAPASPVSALPVMGLQHLKDFLGNRYNERDGLRANVAKAFQDPLFGDLFRTPMGKIDGPTKAFTPAMKDHLIDQVVKMIENENEAKGSYVLYSAASSHYAVFQDLMTNLRSELDISDHQKIYRLFNEGFDAYENANALQHRIYNVDKKHDTNSDKFGFFGMCCSLTPFQSSQAESAMDFWMHDTNISETDLLEKVILPKLGITNPQDIARFKPALERIQALSKQMGGRMYQMQMSKQDIDRYTWISGRYGYKLPAAAKTVGPQPKATDKLSEAMEFYRENPQAFIAQNRKVFDSAIQTYPEKMRGEVYYKQDVSCAQRPRDDNQFLGQLQARLYLHPDLMHSDRLKINTYNSLAVSDALKQQYEQELKALTADILETHIRLEKQKQLAQDKMPKEIADKKAPLLFLGQMRSPATWQKALTCTQQAANLNPNDRKMINPTKA